MCQLPLGVIGRVPGTNCVSSVCGLRLAQPRTNSAYCGPWEGSCIARPPDPPLFTLQGQRPPAQSRKTGENLNILLQQCWSEAPPHTGKRLRSSGPIADKPGSSAAWQVPTNICALGTMTYTASRLSPRSKAACSRPHGANVTDSFALLPHFHHPQTEWSSATGQKPWGQQPQLGKQVPG